MNEIKLINLANLLKLASLVEMATGLALIVSPSFMALLLLNSELARVGVAIGRVAGFGLFALGISCWPNLQMEGRAHPAWRAMWIYNVLITIYLVVLGLEGQWVGWMLWPAASFHAIMTILLAWMRCK